MDEQQWTGQLDLTVCFDGNRSVSRDIFFEKALKVIRPVYLNPVSYTHLRAHET